MRVQNPVLRGLLVALGWVALVLGIIGIPLPVLPTTPFLLLAAALWARSSERFFVMLLTHKVLGPPIVNYRRDGCISPRAKVLAAVMITVTMGFSIATVVPVLPGKIGMAAIGLAVIGWIVSRPSTPRRLTGTPGSPE